jgi:hypothetical protein
MSYRCTTRTASSELTVEGDATPNPSNDETMRVVWGTDDVGKGIEVTIQPLEAEEQFVLHAIVVRAVQTNAGAEDR